MRKIILYNFIFPVILISCSANQGQANNTADGNPVQQILHVELNETAIGRNFDNIDLASIPRISAVAYDSLQLNKVAGLQGYDTADMCLGRVLWTTENGKIITIQVITDGEITEYLLSYDKDGNLMDNLIVAYEDMVENYSEVSSVINERQITVQSVEFNYFEEDGESTETADTAITRYQISPELRFIMN